jgi:fibronectin type 3 domain-containing protein
VPGGGFDAAPTIDLSWESNPDPGVVSYNVYRGEGDQPVKLVTPQPVQVPAWRDLHVKPGTTYTYRVTAVDEHGNESAPSPEIHETLRK